eukprot:2694437-Pleurochrysis_carterae.AAC.2
MSSTCDVPSPCSYYHAEHAESTASASVAPTSASRAAPAGLEAQRAWLAKIPSESYQGIFRESLTEVRRG